MRLHRLHFTRAGRSPDLTALTAHLGAVAVGPRGVVAEHHELRTLLEIVDSVLIEGAVDGLNILVTLLQFDAC